jgi:hypothetical protein
VVFAIETGVGSHVYDALLFVHIASAIVGFGGVVLNGAYAAQAKRRPGAPGLAVSQANFRVTLIAEKFIYLVLLAGLLLVWASAGTWSIGDPWIWLSIVVFVLAMTASHGVLIPNHRRINRLLAEIVASPPAHHPPPQVARIERLGKQQAASSMVLHVALVVLLALMIWKPGA